MKARSSTSYPVIIAPAYQLADKALVDRWTDYVKKGGNLVLTCRTAQKDRHGRLPEAPFGSMINELTGNEMEFYDLLLPEEPGKLRMDGKEYTWNTWGEILKPGKDHKYGLLIHRNFMKENRQSLLVSWEKVLLLTWEWIVRTDYWRKIF